MHGTKREFVFNQASHGAAPSKQSFHALHFITQHADYFLHLNVVPTVNLVFGVPCLTVMLLVSSGFVRRIVRSTRTKKRW